MAELAPITAAAGLLPVTHGGVTLSEPPPQPITSVALLAGADGSAFEAAVGAPFPGPGEVSGRAVWTGRRQCLVLGAAPGGLPGHAVTDQSDAWALLRLAERRATAVLARLAPVDLRLSAFPPGRAARTMLSHMSCILIRREAEAFEIMVFRSMTQTAVHDLSVAMTAVAARG